MIPKAVPTQSILIEMHDRHASLIVGTIELMDASDVQAFFKALQDQPVAETPSVYTSHHLSESHLEDHELQEVLASRLHTDITKGVLDISSLSEAMREDFTFRLDAYLHQPEMEFSM